MPRPRTARRPTDHPLPAIALEIAEVAPGGDGVAIVSRDGERRAVFVRGGAPGDRIEARVDFRSRPARGQITEVTTAGPDRVVPPCPHTMRCGGCNWMHLASDAQTRIHLEHLRAALPEAWREHPIDTASATGTSLVQGLGYRTRARVHVRASGGRAIVGMHAPSSHEPIEVDICRVLHPTIERARLTLEPLFERAHGTGEVEIALGSAGTYVLAVRWSGALPAEVYARFERATAGEASGEARLGGASIVCGEATRPALIGDPTPWMRGADGLPLRLAVGGFAQASEEGNLHLARRVGELAARVTHAEGRAHIAELYAGAGNFTVLLARHGQVLAVESHAGACRAAQANLAERALDAKVVEADASSFTLPKSLHLLVLDPPRTGARAVCEQIAALRNAPRSILYVSCDLATLGRDLQILAPLYRPRAIEAFEIFPQTSHLETLVLLERAR